MNIRGRQEPRHLRARLLSEDEDAPFPKGRDPRNTAAENAGLEGVFDRPDDALDWPDVAPSPAARALARQGRGSDTEVAHVTRGGGRIGKRKAMI